MIKLLNFLCPAHVFFFLAIFYVKPPFRIFFPFVLAAAFYALPGILVMPLEAYVSGLVSMAAIFGIYMICLAVEKYKRTKSHAFKGI